MTADKVQRTAPLSRLTKSIQLLPGIASTQDARVLKIFRRPLATKMASAYVAAKRRRGFIRLPLNL